MLLSTFSPLPSSLFIDSCVEVETQQITALVHLPKTQSLPAALLSKHQAKHLDCKAIIATTPPHSFHTNPNLLLSLLPNASTFLEFANILKQPAIMALRLEKRQQTTTFDNDDNDDDDGMWGYSTVRATYVQRNYHNH